MRRKIVALIDQNKDILDILERVEVVQRELEESCDFFNKRFEQMKEEANEKKTAILNELHDLLVSKGVEVPPGASADSLYYSTQENTVFYCIKPGEEQQVTIRQIPVPKEVEEAMLEYIKKHPPDCEK